MFLIIENHHTNNTSAPSCVLLYKNTCKRILFVLPFSLVCLIRGRVTKRSYAIHLQLFGKEVRNLKKHYLSSWRLDSFARDFTHVMNSRNEPHEIRKNRDSRVTLHGQFLYLQVKRMCLKQNRRIHVRK